MAMIGNGAQAEFQALANEGRLWHRQHPPLRYRPRATEKAARNLDGSGLKIVSCRSAQEAIEGAEIVYHLYGRQAVRHDSHRQHGRAGIHINAIGGDCPGKTELHCDILKRSDVFVEYPPQTRIEGEIQQMAPRFSRDRILEGRHGRGAGPARRPPDHPLRQCRLRDQDFSALRYVRDRLPGTDFYQNLT